MLVSSLALVTILFSLSKGAAQPYSCSAGTVSYIKCYLDDAGYISDVQYRSTPTQTISASPVCQSTQQQLSATKPSEIYLAVGEHVTAMGTCSDPNGVRGLVFSTSLGQSYSCGSQVTGCPAQQGTSLGGFAASCSPSSGGLKRVLGIADICWTPNYTPPTTPDVCASGQGSPGGGIPCQPCAVGEYSDGDSGMCMPCPPGSFTLQEQQSKCGCLPGYGTTADSPNECLTCPAGTYSSGGSMTPCTKCPDGFESAAGAPSARFCVCKAGLGAVGGVCKACAKGYFNPGIVLQRIVGKDGVAPATNISSQNPGELPPGIKALRAAVLEAQEVARNPTNNKCTSCGTGYTTANTGASSKNDCIKGDGSNPGECPSANQELVDDVCVCSAGFESDDYGDCNLCSPGQFKANAGDTACADCPAGKVANADRTRCVTSGSSPPGPSPPGPPAGPCQNTCVNCDIPGLVVKIKETCAGAPDSLVFATDFCSAKNSAVPAYSTDPASVLSSSFGDLFCSALATLSTFQLTVTDTGSCSTQPLTCTVSGY